jgi:hypothetical protein
MTAKQREVLIDLEIVISVLSVSDNTYCINKLKIIAEKLVEEFNK